MILFYRALGTLSIFLIVCLYSSHLKAQVNSTLEQRSRENIIRINSIPWEQLNIKSSIEILDSLQNLAEQEKDERLLWYSKAYRYLAARSVPKAPGEKIKQYKSLLKFLSDHCPETEVTAHFGCVYAMFAIEQKQFDSGFKALFLAKGQFEKLGYDNMPCSGEYLYAIGLCYYLYEDYGNCIKSLEKGKKYRFTKRNTGILLKNTLGMAHLRTGSYKLAERNFTETISLATAIGDSAYIGIGTGNYGNALRLEGMPKQSLPYFYKSITINHLREPGSAAITYVYAAKALLALDSAKKARQFLDKSIQLAGKNSSYNITNYRRHYLEASALYYRKIGNVKMAADFLDSTISLKDSLQSIFNKKIVAITEWTIDAEQQKAIVAKTESNKKSLIEIRNGLLFLIFAVVVSLMYVFYRRELKLRVEKRIQEEKKQHAESALADATQQLKTYLSSIQEKNSLIENFSEELKQLKLWTDNSEQNKERAEEIELRRQALLESVILTEKDWIHFRRLFDTVYPDFLEELNSKYPSLTSNETRLMVLLKLEVSNKQMAFILGVSIAAIRKSRQRLRRKLDAIDPDNELKDMVDSYDI